MTRDEAKKYLTQDPHYLSTAINQVAAEGFLAGYKQGVFDSAKQCECDWPLGMPAAAVEYNASKVLRQRILTLMED